LIFKASYDFSKYHCCGLKEKGIDMFSDEIAGHQFKTNWLKNSADELRKLVTEDAALNSLLTQKSELSHNFIF